MDSVQNIPGSLDLNLTLLFAADSSSNTSAQHFLAALSSDPAHATGIGHT